jgi:hypothetical protein
LAGLGSNDEQYMPQVAHHPYYWWHHHAPSSLSCMLSSAQSCACHVLVWASVVASPCVVDVRSPVVIGSHNNVSTGWLLWAGVGSFALIVPVFPKVQRLRLDACAVLRGGVGWLRWSVFTSSVVHILRAPERSAYVPCASVQCVFCRPQ